MISSFEFTPPGGNPLTKAEQKLQDFSVDNTIAQRSPQDFPELEFFDRIESSFAEIAARYQQPHRKLLALNWAARYHGLPSGAFRQAFQLWLESQGGHS